MFVGLELLWKSISDQLKSKSDAVVCLIHWILLKNSFKCIGTGDKKSDESISEGSELLPEGWNCNQSVYTLLYTDASHKYQVKIVKADNLLLVNVSNLDNRKISSIAVDPDAYLSDDYRSYSRNIFKSLEKLIKEFEIDVVEKIREEKIVERSVETRSDDNDPLRAPETRPRHLDRMNNPDWDQFGDPLAVGGADIDPLGHGVGGMLMDPRGLHNVRIPRPGHRVPAPGNLPPGSVPPGARFDPFGPFPDSGINPRRPGFSEPDPDHLPPPGYSDMFM